MARTVRIGFVGTGGIAQSHLRRIAEIPEAEVVALCDINEQRVREVAAPLKAAVFTDAAKLIAESKLDALYVCVPPHAHGDIEVRAAQRGLHLFVEKPVNLYIDQGLRAWEAIKKAGVLTQVGYSLRYLAGSVQLKKFLEDKAVGSAHAFRWGSLAKTPWWRRYDQSGGQLVEQTTHQLDLMRWVMGEVEAVSASYSFKRLLKDEADVTIPDTQAVLLHFKSGASATINTSCATDNKFGLSGMDFLVKGARVIWKGEGITVDSKEAFTVPPLPPEVPSIDAAFIRSVASGNPALLRSPFDDALKSAAVTIAANQSAENGGKLVRMEELLGAL